MLIVTSFVLSLSTRTFARCHRFFKKDTGSLPGTSNLDHHVDISPDHQKYLGFAWPFNDVLRYFTFAVLPFGLSGGCFCFTKLLRPLVKRWRSMGHNSFVYLDDGFGSQPERNSAVAAAFIQRKELDSSGLLVNEEKSHWVPIQVGEWLGFVIKTISMTFRIPEKKVCKLKRLLNSAIQNRSSSYRELARIAGSIISVALAVGPFSRLLTRQMYLAIESRSAWDHIFLFPPALLGELKFWFCNIKYFNGYSIGPPPIHPLLYLPTRATQLSEAFPPPWTALWPAVCSRLTIWVKVLLFAN